MAHFMRIAIVENSRVDALAMRAKMRSGDNPFLRDIELVFFDKPLPSIEDYRQYDGVILDQHLGDDILGTDIAQKIHAMDWHIPIMLATGDEPYNLPSDARDYLDAIAYKNSVGRGKTEGEFGTIRAWLRQIARVKDALASSDHGASNA